MFSPKHRRKSIILRIVLLAFAVFSIVNLINLEADLLEKNREKAEKVAELEEKNLQISEALHLLEDGNEAELIEKAARERLGYVYPDEKVYQDLSGQQ